MTKVIFSSEETHPILHSVNLSLGYAKQHLEAFRNSGSLEERGHTADALDDVFKDLGDPLTHGYRLKSEYIMEPDLVKKIFDEIIKIYEPLYESMLISASDRSLA